MDFKILKNCRDAWNVESSQYNNRIAIKFVESWQYNNGLLIVSTIQFGKKVLIINYATIYHLFNMQAINS